MKTVVIFTQNLKLESINEHLEEICIEDGITFVTTHFLFENERTYLKLIFNECEFKTFADFLSDEEMATCDTSAYTPGMDYNEYLRELKKSKNIVVANKVLAYCNPIYKFIFSNDLGIDCEVWMSRGFKYITGEYYYPDVFSKKAMLKSLLKKIPGLKKIKNYFKPAKVKHEPSEVFVGYYNNRKYVFLGKLNRIGYRLNIDFELSEEERVKIDTGRFETKETCTYMTTWHEHGKCNVPDSPEFEVRWAQDGYLPPNYSHKDYFFKPNNVKYYCWDYLGMELFKNQALPYEMIPFRKKLYIPMPVFPDKVKNILVVASGSGDWTALKNRSDDDIMVDAIVQMAKRFPDIHFTYRCHPTWVHPQNVGVNAINRVQEYFAWLHLPNLKLSSNIPPMNTSHGFQYSFSRSSLEDDLCEADFVIGEHSISMIDAAFRGIPFFSVNLTGRRNFFKGINDLGFPYCEKLDAVEKMIISVTTSSFQDGFINAVKAYNEMTNIE